MNKYLLILLFSLLGTQLIAQSNCERNLNEARADYSSGNLYAIPGKLADCLEDGFSKPDKIAALRLLTLTYININQQEKAKSTFIKLLNIQTDFQVQENVDPSELYSLYRKIDTDIKYFIGVTFGLNLNDIRVTDPNNTNPVQSKHSSNYSTKFPSPQIGVGVQFLYPITKNWVVGSEVQFQNHKFLYSETNYYDLYDNSQNGDDNYSIIEYEASNSGINLNINIRYMKDYYTWKPFIELGGVGRYNLSYSIPTYTNNYFLTVEDEIISGYDISHRRNNFNVGINANIGTMRKIGENYAEIKFGISNYFVRHLNEKARNSLNTYTIADGMALAEDNYTNFVYQVSFTFNIPFFNFQ